MPDHLDMPALWQSWCSIPDNMPLWVLACSSNYQWLMCGSLEQVPSHWDYPAWGWRVSLQSSGHLGNGQIPVGKAGLRMNCAHPLDTRLQVSTLSISILMNWEIVFCLDTPWFQKYKDHCSIKPLQPAGSPAYLSGHAMNGEVDREGVAEGASVNVIMMWICTSCDWLIPICCCCSPMRRPGATTGWHQSRLLAASMLVEKYSVMWQEQEQM